MGIHNQPINREIIDEDMSEDIFKDAPEIQKPEPMQIESDAESEISDQQD